MLKKIVLDLETQNTFDEVGGRNKHHLLKVSVCGVYFYATNEYKIYRENELPILAPLLQESDLIIGFNIKDFDFAVLQPYISFDLSTVPYYDLLEEIEKSLGHRVSLESVAQGTIGSGKSGKGLDAIKYYREGDYENLERYCLDDVRVTKAVYDYALIHQKVRYKDYFGDKDIPIVCQEPQPRGEVQRQESLF